jgi:Phage integrase family
MAAMWRRSGAGHGEGKARPLARLAGGGERAAVCRASSAANAHGDAFADLVGAEGAVTAWKRHMLAARSSPATVNQALATVTLMYEQAALRIAVKRSASPGSAEADALTRRQEAALRRAAGRRGPRDAAITGVLLDTGARVEKCARLDAEDFAITARTGKVRLHGKGDEVRSVPLARRGRELVLAWLDVRGPLRPPWWPAETCRPRSPTVCWAGSRSHVCPQGIYTSRLADSEGQAVGNVCRESRRDPNAEKPPRQGRNRHLTARRVKHHHRTGIDQPVHRQRD